MATWRTEILKTMAVNGDIYDDNAFYSTLTDTELDEEFDKGFEGPNGESFTVWTSEWVYFPVCYDGLEWCGSVPRNPNGSPTVHQGG